MHTEQQQTEPNPSKDIISLKLNTSFGKVHSLCFGEPNKNLILIINASQDSKNETLLNQYIKIKPDTKNSPFYVVAIDCPGYGLTEGDKSVIKNHSVKFFRQILEELKHQKYYAMVCLSQAGNILNAATATPNLTDYIILNSPVCGDVKRFLGFAIPTLLVYDKDCEIPALSHGKTLYKQIMRSEIHLYKSSMMNDWVVTNIWGLMLQFFTKNLSFFYKNEVQHSDINPRKLTCEKEKLSKIEKENDSPKNIMIAEQRKKQLRENKCAICFEIFFKPVVTNCKHVFCLACLSQAMQFKNKCPLCRAKIQTKTEDQNLHQQILQILPLKEINYRKNLLNKYFKQLDGQPFYVMIGNTSRAVYSTKYKTIYEYQIYVKNTSQFPFRNVTFTVQNGGKTKSQSCLLSPFIFQDRHTSSFESQITFNPKKEGYYQQKIKYVVNLAPGNHTKLILFKKPQYLRYYPY